jgi:Ser/Thr protein kinase RdoA (MazF antagonist)
VAAVTETTTVPDRLPAYLAERGLLPEHAAHGPWPVQEIAHSARVVAVPTGDGRRLVVKGPRPAAAAAAGMSRELAVYQLAVERPGLAAVLPRCVWVDPDRSLLVFVGAAPGHTLHALTYRAGRPDLAITRALGAAFAAVHAAVAPPRPHALPTEAPWVLALFTPGGWQPAPTARLLPSEPERRDVAARLDALRDSLVARALIHGDAKWDNVLVHGTDDRRRVLVIDWEAATWGDPAWDLAGILADAETFALHRPEARGDDAVAVFFDSYERGGGQDLRDRARALVGARLLQSALEYAAVDASPAFTARLTTRAIALLRDPGEAAQ